jgi:hypothetical protein
MSKFTIDFGINENSVNLVSSIEGLTERDIQRNYIGKGNIELNPEGRFNVKSFKRNGDGSFYSRYNLTGEEFFKFIENIMEENNVYVAPMSINLRQIGDK